MKFKDFEDAMFLKGYNTVLENGFIKVFDGQCSIVAINDNQKFNYILYSTFHEFTDEHQAELFELIAIYVATPIHERHNQKKYHIIIKHPKFDAERKFLNFRNDGTIVFNNANDSERYKTQFTELEIIEHDLLPFVHNPLFERIEVGENEC